MKAVKNLVCCCVFALLGMSGLQAQIAQFSFSQNCGLVQFTDLSVGAETYLWDFGDGEQSILENPAHFYETPGDYTVSLTIANSEGQGDFHVETLSISANEPLPYLENFEDGVSDNWQLFQQSGTIGWEIWETDCNGMALSAQNFGSDGAGEEHVLYGRFDLTNVSNGQISMDYAYAQTNTESADELKVRVTICEFADTYTGFEKAGAELATAPMQETAFVPNSCDDWQTETVNLDLLQGFTVLFEFINVNHGGNNIYIDNITFSGDVETSIGTIENRSFQLFPNPADENATVDFKDAITNPIELELYNISGVLIEKLQLTNSGDLQFNTSHLESGIYLLKHGGQSRKLIVQH